MNLYLRVLIVLIASFFKPKIASVLEPSVLRLHVLPNDLDLHGHMNNARYLSAMDLGRFDMVLRTALVGLMLREKSVPILAAVKMRYRLPLMPFQAYDLHTRVLCWDEKWIYLEQRFVIARGDKAGAVAAIALVKGGFWSKAAHATLPTAEMLKTLGMAAESPAFPAWLQDWLKADEALKSVTAG